MIRLVKTCNACPEQYEAFIGDRYVGYFRLRWGNLRVDYPDCGGETIYEARVGSGLQGIFDSEEQRIMYLNRGCRAILAKMEGMEVEQDEQPLYILEDKTE